MTEAHHGPAGSAGAGTGAAQVEDVKQPSVRVTDRRRLDPDGGLRTPAAGSAPAAGEGAAGDGQSGVSGEAAAPAPADQGDPTAVELAERTEDLRRLKAEYDNYRRRIERDRASWGEQAVAKVLADVLPALDDVDRARAHDALDGAFRAVADQVEKAVAAAGLTRFGAAGDPFDPARHEALSTVPTPDAQAETVLEVYRAGYEFGGRVLRAAQVVVAVPAD